MKNLGGLCFVMVLTGAFTISALAGEIHTPGAPDPGEIHTPGIAAPAPETSTQAVLGDLETPGLEAILFAIQIALG